MKPNKIALVSGIIIFILICFAYSNHFTNGFEFDDSHTIVHNEYIRNIKNIPLFFTDIKYYGTNPGNQGYNPVLTSLNAFDYWLAGGLNSVYFHVHIFISYIVLLIILFYFFKNIFKISFSPNNINILSVLIVGFYGVHAANAETINYIIMRSDSFSTLCIVLSVLLYTVPIARKYGLYLLVLLVGVLTKEVGVMAGPLLFFYILLFEEKLSLSEALFFRNPKASWRVIKKSFPALFVSFGSFIFIREYFVPEDTSLIAPTTTSNPFQYFYTQWVVLVHYIGNFILPLDLSADPDFVILDSIINRKVLLSLFLILALVIIAFICSSNKERRPITYGIMWFFISLAPTSSFIPFGQIANDHRTFLPYIGLVLSLGCWFWILFNKHKEIILLSKPIQYTLVVIYILIIFLHVYGTRQRNEVWSSSEKLWHDVTIKSPNNGRGLMNYALILMQRGDYEGTLPYFEKALKLMPYWAYIHINMGILKNAMGKKGEAEMYFQNAINYQPFVPDGYYYYARFLHDNGRADEAIIKLEEGLKISPAHHNLKILYSMYMAEKGTDEDKLVNQIDLIKQLPTYENYINLGLTHYRMGSYQECINACLEALKLNPNSSVAYNNICSAYNAMSQWEKASEACRKALEIEPTHQLAKNNLKWAEDELKKAGK